MSDPIYADIPARLRTMNERQLAAEEREASDALSQLVSKHLTDSQNDTPEGLAIELRLLEAQLALNLKVRDNTIAGQIATDRARGGLTLEGEELIRNLAYGTFRKDIDRIHSQLVRCREKLVITESGF